MYKRIVLVFNLDEKERTKSWVLSPSSDTNIKRNEIIKG